MFIGKFAKKVIKMSDIKVAFMFGAGAEGIGNFNLPMGDAFQANTLLKNKNKEDEGNALKKFFKNDYRKNTIHDSVSIYRVLKYSLKNYLDNDKIKEEVKSNETLNRYCTSILSKNDYIELFGEKCYNRDLYSEEYNKGSLALWNMIIDYMAGNVEKYSFIIDKIHYKNFLKYLVINHKKEQYLEFSDSVVFALLLDQKFHTIIDRKKYGINSFYMVFNYYWHCYFYIVAYVIEYFYLNQDEHKKEIEALKNFVVFQGKNIHLKYDDILTNISRFTQSLYSLVIHNEDCYYHYIKQMTNKDDSNIQVSGIITTNYFCFAEGYFQNIAYINGQLKNFEFPEDLEVHDACEKEDVFKDRLFFPFVFGQSYVKPIIHPRQIAELKKMKDILDKSSVLVILGYNINSDDNHINAYLHDFVQHKKIIYVSNNGNSEQLLKKLHLKNASNIEFLHVEYGNNKEVISDIMKYLENKR